MHGCFAHVCAHVPVCVTNFYHAQVPLLLDHVKTL